MSVAGVPAEKFFVYDGLQCRYNYYYCSYYGYPQTDPSYGIASNPKVMVMVEFDTEQVEADLPKGRVRVYQEDIDGAALLIGEDAIDHTPEGGARSPVRGRCLRHRRRAHPDRLPPAQRQPVGGGFRDHAEQSQDGAVEIRVVDTSSAGADGASCAPARITPRWTSPTIEFRVRAPANGETTLSYSVRYFWP